MLDFNNSQIAFANKSNRELRKAAFLFSLMNKPWFVNWSSKLGLWALNNRIPFTETIIKQTIFGQFCGGITPEDCSQVISQLADQNVQTILDYGAEAKNSEIEFNASMEELIRAIDFASNNQSVPLISLKMTGLVKFELLEKTQKNEILDNQEKIEYQNFLERLITIGKKAEEKLVGIFIDAEESWIQNVIDHRANDMMEKHNKNQAIIFNTFQMYRHDRLDFLKKSYQKAKDNGYFLGAKIVRGAYMEKERARAKELNYPSPIQKDKAATDRDFNDALNFCVKNYQEIASYNASHNLESNAQQAALIIEKGIDKKHPHLNFCQLYGMSDQITFNLGANDFNTMKYVPYGQINEVIPYLIRRAQENASVKGEMGREYQLISEERRRRAASTILPIKIL